MNTVSRRLPLYALALGLTMPSLVAQQKTQEDFVAQYEEMQTHSWFTGGGWLLDLDEAKAQSKKTGKPIFAYFTRTYSP